MASLGQSLDLVFKMKAEGADAVQRDIKQTSAIIQNETGNTSLQTKTQLDDLTKSSATSSGALASLGAIASGTAVAVGALAVGVGAAAYGLFTLANAAAKSGQDLFKLQQATGLNAETLSSLRLAAIEANVELGSLNDILVDFTQLMLQAAGGNEEAKKKLEELGVTAKNADQGVAQLLKTIYEAPDIYKAAELASKATGASIADLQRIAIAAKGEMEALKERAKELGIVLDNDAARAANEFAKDMEIVTLQIQSQAYAFARQYMPQIASALRSVGQYISDNRETFIWWGQTIAWWIAEGVKNFVSLTQAAQKMASLVSSAFDYLGSNIFASMARSTGAVGGLIAQTITLLGLLRQSAADAEFYNKEVKSFDATDSAFRTGVRGPRNVLNNPVVTPKVGGGGGRARGGGGGGAATKVDAVAEQAKADALELQKHKDQLAELAAADKKDLADRKISKELYDQLQRANDAQAIAYELELLEKRSKIASATVEQKAKMNADIATLQSQLRIAQTEADAAAADSEKTASEEREQRAIKYADLIKRLTAERVQSEQELQDKRAETERKQLESDVKNAQAAVKYAANQKELEAAHNDLLTALIVLREFDIARLKEAQRLADQKAEDEAAAAKKKLEDDKLTEQQLADAIVEIDKKKKNKLLENREQFLAGKAIIDEKYGEQSAVPVTPGEDPKRKKANFKDFFGALNEKPESGEDQFAQVRDASGALEELEALGVGAMQRMGAALGSAIEQWALYGGSVGQALKKALAAELAYIAGVATINAIYATALGFMRLAQWDFVGAGNAFISAGIWAAVAGGSALAARALSGGGKSTQNQAYDFRSNTIDSNNSSRAAGNNTQMLSESRTQRQDQRITLEVTSRDSHIVRVVGDNLNQRGDLFPVVVRLVEQN